MEHGAIFYYSSSGNSPQECILLSGGNYHDYA